MLAMEEDVPVAIDGGLEESIFRITPGEELI